MVKNLWAQFEFGGRNLFHRSQQHFVRSRRQLHYAFWSHAALEIPLPPWWILLLQSPVTEDERILNRNAVRRGGAIISQLRGLFLDFLYPLRASAHIKNLQRSVAAHQKATQNIRNRYQNYNTIARSLITRSSASVLTGDQLPLSTTASENANLGENLRRNFEKLLTDGPSHDQEELWSTYQSLLRSGQCLSTRQIIGMLKRLSASGQEEDSRRLLKVYYDVPVGDRRALHYSHAITASLKLGDCDAALCSHREATSRHIFSAGAPSILRHAVTQHEWDKVAAVLHPFSGSAVIDSSHQDIWSDVEILPFNFLARCSTRAVEAAQQRKVDKEATLVSPSKTIVFELMKRTFTIRGPDIKIPHLQTFVSILSKAEDAVEANAMSSLQTEALRQLLSLPQAEAKVAAIKTYAAFRKSHPSYHCPQEVLAQIIREWDVVLEFSLLESLIADFQNNFGPLGTNTFWILINTFSVRGYASETKKVFDLYRVSIDGKGTLKKAICNQYLMVHFRRADPHGVIQAFHELEKMKGYKPDITRYNIVLTALARVSDADSVQPWIDKMENDGFEPSEKTYFELMHIFSERGDQEMVEHLLEQMQAKGIARSAAMHFFIMLTHVNNGRLDDAESLLEDHLTHGPAAERTPIWNILLTAYARRGHLEKVKAIHSRMREIDIPSDGSTYAAIVRALVEASFTDAARTVVSDVMPKSDLRPTSLHFAIVMEGYRKSHEYNKVFSLYELMLHRKVTIDIGSKLILLRSAAEIDQGDNENGTRSEMYPRALEILKEITASLDPSELASLGPYRFVSFQNLNEAWISTYFEFIIRLHGAAGAFDIVSKTFEKYVSISAKFSDRDIASSPPMQMVAALLVAHKKAGNHEQVERCWYLALDKCDQLARRALTVSGASSSSVLPSRRFIVNIPLGPYISHLGNTERYDEMVDVVTDLLDVGWELDGENLNQYIQYLCRSPDSAHQLMALTLCEKLLMPSWNGWDSMGRVEGLHREFRTLAKATAGRAPAYRTFVWLARVYVDLGFGSAKWKTAEVERMHRHGELSRTLEAVANLPARYDRIQQDVLGRDARGDIL